MGVVAGIEDTSWFLNAFDTAASMKCSFALPRSQDLVSIRIVWPRAHSYKPQCIVENRAKPACVRMREHVKNACACIL